MSKEISCETFAEVDLRIGTIIRAEAFLEARKPAIKVWADFGPEIGVKKSSAQITKAYAPETLPGRQILGVVNFPPRQIGPFRSEFLLTGFAREDGAIILAVPDLPAPNGARLI